MKNIMERVINEVTDHKGQSDLLLCKSKSLKMSSQNGAISEYKVASTQILGIRVMKDDKVGLSYTETFDEDSLKFMVKQALQNAEMSSPNSYEKLLDLKGSLSDRLNKPEAEVDIKHKTERTIELESRVKHGDHRVTAVPYNMYSESEYESFYLSSMGRETNYFDKSYTIATSALMDHNGKKSNYDDYNLAHTFMELEWDKVSETALFHARNILEEKPLHTGKYSVMFNIDCFKSLVGCFSHFYSAKSAIDKMNPWGTKLGEVVASKDLTITDHPLYERSFRTSIFDSEGVERKPLTLIENGVLKSLYHNSVTARTMSAATTGHAVQSPGGALGIGGTDLIISGSNVKPLPVKYLEVIQMDGLYSGANRVNGNFSVAVKGYVWDKGERTMTFGNITLSGNIMNMFKNVEVVGEVLQPSTDNSFFSVPLIFPELSIGGI